MGHETKVLGGRYELQTEIARGAIGTVWRALDLTTGEQVAVKVLLPEAEHDPDVVKSLLDEAQILAELNHPSIVRARDVVANGVHALVMDLVEGADVRHRIRTNGPLRPAEVAEIGAQTADALAAVHAAGILHGDIKPGNILMPKDGGPVKLGDFGVARRIQLPDTVTHATPEYVAPEVVAGIKPAASSDVYSLGMVLYEMASGRSPYRGGTVAEVIERHAACVPVQPAGMPDELWDLVLRCVELEPGNRPSAAQAAGELRRMAPLFVGRPAAALLPEYAMTYRPRLIDPAAPVSPAAALNLGPAPGVAPQSPAAPVFAAPQGLTAPVSPAPQSGPAPVSVAPQTPVAPGTVPAPVSVPADGPLWPDSASAFPSPTSPAPTSPAPTSPAPVSSAPTSSAPTSSAPVSPASVSAAPGSPGPIGTSPVSAGPVSGGAAPAGVAPVGSGAAQGGNGAAATSVLSLFDQKAATGGAAVPPKKVGTGSKAPFIAVAAALFLLIGIGIGLMIWAGTTSDKPEAKAPATSPDKKDPKSKPSDKPSKKPSPGTSPESPAASPNQPAPTQPDDNNDHFADNDGSTGGGTIGGSGTGGQPGLGDPLPTMPR
jgi:serine/threonine-protein kinase